MDSSLVGGNHNKKTCVSEVENDLLSNHLPDYLIDSILERVPIKDAVRTSILSRNWRYKWTRMSSMILDEHFSYSLPKNGTSNIYRDVFITITNQLFKFLKGPILKVHLHIPNVSLDDSFFKVQLEQWILSLSYRGVTELVIYNLRKRDVQLPWCLFHCSQLRKLQLSCGLMFKPPPKLEGYFLNLQHLSFKNISFESCETVIKLPQLTKMNMIKCTHVYNFKIMAPKLKFVKVVLCLDAAKFLRVLLLNSRSLTTVHFFMLTLPEIKKVNLVPRLCNLPYLASLSIDGYFFKSCIVENIPKWLSHAAKRLKTLDFFNLNFGDLYQLQSALCLLRNSPNLKQLTVIWDKDLDRCRRRRQYMHLDVKPTLTYLKASGCFDQTLRRLKTITITGAAAGSKSLMLFIKLLLNHSPALEMISIQPSFVTRAADDVHQRWCEDVTCFPRASSKAELLFLDP